MAMLGSALVFGLTTLFLLTGLTCLFSALLVPAEAGPEKQFEKRLEYGIFTLVGLVGFAVLMVIG
jgi:formate hydrogenlyase subunit 3/multisubunit Na+/H+ antiporter MnhD subunit